MQKNASTGAIEVASTVYRVEGLETASGPVALFPTKSRNNFCYVVVDPLRRAECATCVALIARQFVSEKLSSL